MATQAQSPTTSNNQAVASKEQQQLDHNGNTQLKTPILDEEKAPSYAGRSDSDKEDTKAKQEPVNPMHPSQFPDGGKQAWLCVAGSSACLFVSFGWINAVGVFQNYYQTGPLREYSPSTVGWIVSTEVFFMLFMSPWVGLFFDNFGPRWLLIGGTFLHVFGLMMASLSTEYYQFFLSQGVCSAIGASMLFGPGMTCVSTWFFRKRGAAMGLCAAGSSLGGVIFPIVVSRMVPRTGFPWAMRTCAFLVLALMIFANFTVTARVPPRKRKFEFMAFIRPLKELTFSLVVIALWLFYWGMFIPFAFIVADATSHGMSLSLAEYLVSILNAGSIFGRTLPGIIGDKIGRFNTMCIFCILTTILTLAMWIPADTNAIFIAFAPLYGFASGAAISLTPVLIAQISEIRDIGTRTGTAFGLASFAALTGTPIGGALVVENHGHYTYAKIFAGIMCAAGCVFFVASRVNLAGWKWNKKV
ncbi:hypothetical protein LTR70_002300 [Exophiala xenobiotica]|uniref:Major facilitator superfamily (MFS) profile domain-containing protein n=1 Tax=Lithohypha guttulata TaxID=1690604 RepID=A0ABR0KLJ0_9EURO|nr:hypothetical protein LTR24_001278 [Lithohypha guttulata]KAK5326035.1 hypothetical protein LTR70_002300 [Exophiala xenobiotica]